MKNTFLTLLHFFTDFRRYWRPVLLFHLLFGFIFLPLLLAITNGLMSVAGVKSLQLDRIPSLIFKSPLTVGGTLLLAALAFLILFVDFTFLTFVVYFARIGQKPNFRQLLLLPLSKVRQIRLGTFLFMLLYFFILIPLSGLGSAIPIISNIQIPTFIATYLSANGLYIVGLLLLKVVTFYLSYRLIFVLPLIILKGEKTPAAMTASWRLTRRKFWAFFFRLLLAGSILLLLFMGITQGLVLLQTVIEVHAASTAMISATIILFLVLLFTAISTIMNVLLLIYVSLSLFQDKEQFPEAIPLRPIRPLYTWLKWTIRLVSFLGLALLSLGLVYYFQENVLGNIPLTKPLIISHRGVSANNGVQNTLQSLDKTSTEFKPDYVEMDVHQTKDGQFVVFHDGNTKALTGVSKNVSTSTLSELTSLKAKENGMSEPIPSFDSYYKEAEKLHQKLLIEIKTDPKENINQVVDNFLSKYRSRVVKDGDMVHSLNFDLVQYIREKAPDITTYYTMAYNFVGVPQTAANGFSMEVTTLNPSFVDAAHQQHKKVFAWSTNDDATVFRMQYYHVDGLITDNIKLVKNSLAKKSTDLPYSARIQIFLTGNINNPINDLLSSLNSNQA